MDPTGLLPPQDPLGYPAPFWFLEGFKVLGFWLHMGPMQMWYAGSITAVVLAAVGRRPEVKTAAHHLFKTLPFAIALGINFGVIPLLFTQVAYYQFFYPATVLIAWPWFSVIVILLAAYYATYLNVLGISGRFPPRIGAYAAWAAALGFIVIGFIFANTFTLMVYQQGWINIFRDRNISSAATGLAINTGDPTLFRRWLFMFGMAITTVGTFFLADSAFLAGEETEEYRRFTRRLSFGLYTLGLLWFVSAGSLYLFGTRMDYVRIALADPVMKIVFPLTMVSPGLPWLLILLQQKGTTKTLATLTVAAQLGMLGLNAVSRQWLQNMELAPLKNLLDVKVRTQLGGIILFITIFVIGVAIVAWMVWKIVQANRTRAESV